MTPDYPLWRDCLYGLIPVGVALLMLGWWVLLDRAYGRDEHRRQPAMTPSGPVDGRAGVERAAPDLRVVSLPRPVPTSVGAVSPRPPHPPGTTQEDRGDRP